MEERRLSTRGGIPARIAMITAMQQTCGNRAVQRFLQRAGTQTTPQVSTLASSVAVQRKWPDAETKGAKSSRTTAPPTGWNAEDDVRIGSIHRLTVAGLKYGNRHDDRGDSAQRYDKRAKVGEVTSEPAVGCAIALVPEPLVGSDVDVMLYFHGFGIGYRQRKITRSWDPGMETGTVRDVEVDRMEEQLEAAMKTNGRPMVGILPQGAYMSDKDHMSFGYFQSDAYLNDVFSKVPALKKLNRMRVVLAGHSGAGGTIASMLDETVTKKGDLKTEAQIKKGKGVRAPTGLAEVILFDAINGPGERGYVEEWMTAHIRYDIRMLKGKDETAQKAYLRNSMRFRGYHSTMKGYANTYATLKTNIAEATKKELTAAKITLSPDVDQALRDNYENGIHGVNSTHEALMGTGKVEEALKDLPPAGAATPGAQAPAPQPAGKTPQVNRASAHTAPVTIQRDPTKAPTGSTAQRSLTAAEIPPLLVIETVRHAGGNVTLLRIDDVQKALDNRAINAELSAAFDEAVRFVSVISFDKQPDAIRLHAKELIKLLEIRFIHDPDASSIDLLPPDRARRYREFRWHRLDYPGQTGSDRAGPNESRARAMANELSEIRPERRANTGADSVVRESEFNARMRRYVRDELSPLPGQTEHSLNRHAADSFAKMRADAKADGVDLVVGAASRTPERAAANAAASGNADAVGRFSVHILGLAVDLHLSFGSTRYEEITTRPMQNVVDMRESPAHKWMFLRGASYGWYPLQNEPWHWEYNPSGFRDRFRENINAAAAGARTRGSGATGASGRDTVIPAQRSPAVSSTPTTPIPIQSSINLPVQRGIADVIRKGVGALSGGLSGAIGEAVRGGNVIEGAARGAAAGIADAGRAGVTITFGPHAVESTVSQYSLDIVKGILIAADLSSATITSTARTAEDQARAMFENLQIHGVAHQKALYGPAGEEVIDVYAASKGAGKNATQIRADMEAKIIAIGPARVSRHCADDHTKLNVFDVSPRSIGDADANRAFKRAAQAEVGNRVSNFIPYPKDPGHHFEIASR